MCVASYAAVSIIRCDDAVTWSWLMNNARVVLTARRRGKEERGGEGRREGGMREDKVGNND